ncbi:aldehyde dehydrogenase family protein [Bacillus sp. CLL-7-23]|uniref:Aldehyde dehydrogenase family protein n=1 Tax=Bacillus changyiensis TaxID=3004103 RepID=A0ABT4X3C6_9BACI|nr:aldehyde dehydrogenase family protein [Bacillus changyiensis]MDA7026592.1 aldehyde dehydrogenase family protein [Bacillus changyiensis]
MDPFLEKLNLISHKMKQHKNELRTILMEISTSESADYEICSSIDVLEQAARELQYMKRDTVQKVAIFHPTNSILYSYVLYAIIPGFYCKSISLRPSTSSQSPTMKIHNFFKKYTNFNIEIEPIGYVEFKKKTSDAEVVVFTGNYYNGLSVQKDYPNALFIFFGSGLNPFVIGAEADMEYTAAKAVEARLFNSGQDCMCPDLFFVHRSQKKRFIKCLLQQLKEIQASGRMSDKVRNSNYQELVLQTEIYLNDYEDRIVYGGQVDVAKNWIEPSVLVSDIKDMPRCEEHFAPIFNIVSYENAFEVLDWLTDTNQLESSFGVSIFGQADLAEKLKKHYTVSLNQTLFDIENGHQPFGGYGPKASYVKYKDRLESRPILLSKEVNRVFHQYPIRVH